jgi:crotonobetainyl-CoA:carnitine CoA-transferase CaiB-like acyl-CoA transferase
LLETGLETGLDTDSASGPLSGLLVADFSRILAGPYATMLLGDLGAEVVKVEAPAGDDTRTWQPPVREGISTYYLAVNRNKRSIALDLKDPDDLAAAQELARRADVLVENFRPGALARFGLDYGTVSERNPGIVYASISGFGSAPRGRVLPGYDLIVQAMSGLMSLTGDPDGEPYRAGISVFDVMAGLHATIGVLSAVHARGSSGRGQHVELNLLASALSGMVNQTSAYVAGGVVPHRMGNSHPSLFPYEPLPCADGELIITAGNSGQFRKLVEVLGVPGLADDPRFARNEDRTAHRDELRPLLVERLRTRTKMEWFRDIIAAGVPCGPINTVDAGVAFAEEVGLDPVVSVGEGEAAVPSVRNPIRLSETPADYRLPPPTLDEHGEEIRRWLSGPAEESRAQQAPSERNTRT